eukprot:jgi/Tetstr1/454469/TSEL_041369.t1
MTGALGRRREAHAARLERIASFGTSGYGCHHGAMRLLVVCAVRQTGFLSRMMQPSELDPFLEAFDAANISAAFSLLGLDACDQSTPRMEAAIVQMKLLQRAESGYEAVRPVSRVPGLFPLSTDLTNEYLKQDDRRLPAREEYLWMSCFGAHMAALFVALDELLPYVPAASQDFTPYLARARNHAEAIDKAFRFRLAFLRRLNERQQLQRAGVDEDVAVDAGVAAKVSTSDGVGRLSSELLELCEATFRLHLDLPRCGSSYSYIRTFKSYAGRMSQFVEFCHDSENISPLEATTATVVRHVAWIAGPGPAPRKHGVNSPNSSAHFQCHLYRLAR